MEGDPRGPIESGSLRAPPRSRITRYPPALDAGVLHPRVLDAGTLDASVLDGGALDAGVLRAPLAVAVDPLSAKEIRWVYRVACFGGDIEQAALALFKDRYGHEFRDPERRARGDERYADPREYATADELDDIQLLDHLRTMIRDQFQNYDRDVLVELRGLTPIVREHFKPRPDAGEAETLAHYRELRPMYCSAGIDDPKGVVFDKIVESRFLGRRVFVNQQMADALNLLEGTLNAKVEGMSDELAKDVTSAGGFNPRLIANTHVISNHSLGLAIDINPTNNPHIVNKTVIALIKDITKTEQFPDGFDFGSVLVKPEDQVSLDTEAKREQKIKQITEIHARAQQASDILRDWLTTQLEHEKQSTYDIQELGKKVQDWRDKIVNAATQAEAESFRDAYQKAEQTLSEEIAKFNSDGDHQRLDALRKIVGKEVIAQWAKDGIRNLPLDLVLTLVVDLRFTWGDEWKDSKDGMHFDFLKDTDGGVIIPLEKYKGLDEVLEAGPDGL